MAVDLIEKAYPVFQAAVEKVEMGEEITWALSWASIPMPPPQNMVVGYSVYLHMPALHALGAFIQHVFIIPIGSPDALIERAVREQVETLRTQRTRMLTEASNGHGSGPPMGGIIAP
jgi:hypothetical protein